LRQRIPFLRNFNWRILLLRLLINAGALVVTAAVIPKVYFVDRSLVSVLVVALGLGILNALIKPILQLLTLHFIFVSYGLVVVLINTFLLYLLSWLFPQRFGVNGLFWPFVGGALMGLLSSVAESLCGLTAPILPDEEAELRARIKKQQTGGIGTFLEQPLPPLAPETSTSAPAGDEAEVPETLPKTRAATELPEILDGSETGDEATGAAAPPETVEISVNGKPADAGGAA
jgi:putative membrane protein